LRPERVRLHGPTDDAPPRATLQVEDATYVGGHVDYLLGFAGGGNLALHEPTGASGSPRRAAGETVAITWDGSSERLFGSDDAAVAAQAA
nr:TOBE domain-containing protein [Bosea sp. (in: a-proteobacteria)]